MGTISSYTAATAVTDDDVFIGNDGATTKKFPATVIKTYSSATTYTAANTSTSYTATRTNTNEDFFLTLTGNATITLAGGSVAGQVNMWNIVFQQDGTGGRSLVVSSVVWVGGTPTFVTTIAATNHCSFVQYGTGAIYGYYGGTAAS